MHALCLDLLNDKLVPGARALDVGAGSGYLTACMGMGVKWVLVELQKVVVFAWVNRFCGFG